MAWKDHDEALRDLDRKENEAAKRGDLTSDPEPVKLTEWKRKLSRGEIKALVDEQRHVAATHLFFGNALAGITHVPVHWIEVNETGSIVQLHEGNPPADTDRPKHLRGLDLWVDVGGIQPHEIEWVRAIRDRGVDPQAAENARKQLHAMFGIDDEGVIL